MTKRIVSLLMAVMLIIGIFSIPALAAGEDDGIMPHGPICYCGGNCVVKTSDYWRPEGRKSCTHWSNGYDEVARRIVVTKTTCTSCGDVRTSERETSELSRVCYGYN
ncbi:hypothetical protein AALA61_15970 [Oscillospiraceae bacterium 42-9]